MIIIIFSLFSATVFIIIKSYSFQSLNLFRTIGYFGLVKVLMALLIQPLKIYFKCGPLMSQQRRSWLLGGWKRVTKALMFLGLTSVIQSFCKYPFCHEALMYEVKMDHEYS